MTEPERAASTVIVLAGYRKEMQQMLSRNSGLASRFQVKVEFPDWTSDECVALIEKQMRQTLPRPFEDLCEESKKILRDTFNRLKKLDGFGNARDAVLVLEKMDGIRAVRLCDISADDTDTGKLVYTVEDVQEASQEILEQRGYIEQDDYGEHDVPSQNESRKISSDALKQ